MWALRWRRRWGAKPALAADDERLAVLHVREEALEEAAVGLAPLAHLAHRATRERDERPTPE